jgi:hypothetical protein
LEGNRKIRMGVAEDRDNKIKRAVTGRQRLGERIKNVRWLERREEGEVGRWAQMESR